MGVRVTKITGSSSDDWIYQHIGYTRSINYNQYSVIVLSVNRCPRTRILSFH
jgi:hypothetical protein